VNVPSPRDPGAEIADPQSSTRFQSDPELVAALLRREEAAFCHLVTQLHRLMVRCALPYVACREAAEDIAQETWVVVIERLPTFAYRSSLRTWILAILLNRARSHRGAESRRRGSNEAGLPRAPDPTPEENLLRSEVAGRCARVISTLPRNQGWVLYLRDVEGWSAAEVADLLGISRDNQRVILHRARNRFHRAMRRQLGEQA
jgi:RNA polymerase sigma-70 factor, ECF subfamily